MKNNILNISKQKHKTTKKPKTKTSLILTLSLLTLTVLIFLYIFPKQPSFQNPAKTHKTHFPKCQYSAQRFLFYAPHSGFSNQVSEFKNAVLMAGILNRTLVVPPVLDHHAVALGSCPKFRVLEPEEIRSKVWDHVMELLIERRYVSMADIIDISSLVSSSLVRAIDFRDFVSLWCGVNIDFVCSDKLSSASSLVDRLKQCGSRLAGLDDKVDNCVYAVKDDCRTTVWMYQKDNEDGVVDPFQPDEQLKKKKKFSYVRKRRDVLKALGPGSEAESASVLAFPSLFTAPYRGSQSHIDINDAPRDRRIQSLIRKIKYFPFVREIIDAGKKYASDIIKAPFLCAQLRLLDGQFKNHWKATFTGLKQKLEPLRQTGPLPTHIFVMTDLPESNWTGTYLGELATDADNFKLHFLRDEDFLVTHTAKEVAVSGHGLSFNSFSKSPSGGVKMRKYCPSRRLPDVLLFIEETICSCATLGFVGTSGSTIAESIELMRKYGAGPG